MLREQMAEILKNKMALEKCDPNVMSYFTDYYWVSKWVSKDEIASLAQAIHNLYMAWFRAEVKKLTVIEVLSHSESIVCPHCGEEHGLESIIRSRYGAQLQHIKKQLLDKLKEE